MRPLVSFVMPAYNHEAYVADALGSLIWQTWPAIELIVLDDGSTDKTADVVESMRPQLEARFERFVLVRKQNEGICATLNQGLALSTGPLFKYMASDDVLTPRAIEQTATALLARPELGMVYTDGYHVDTADLDGYVGGRREPTVDESQRFSAALTFREGDLFVPWLRDVLRVPSATVMFRRECLDDVGPFDPQMPCEDPDMFLRVARRWPIGCVREPLMYHRVHGTNTGRNMAIIEPAVLAMLVKYDDAFLGTAENRRRLRATLLGALGTPDWELVTAFAAGRPVVGWGTGSAYRRARDRFHPSLAFLVDKNPDRHGQLVDGLRVQAPEALRELGPEGAYVAVFSQFREEIGAELAAWGFVAQTDWS